MKRIAFLPFLLLNTFLLTNCNSMSKQTFDTSSSSISENDVEVTDPNDTLFPQENDYEEYVRRYPGYIWGYDQWIIDFENGSLNNIISFETFGGEYINPLFCFKGQEVVLSIQAKKDGEQFEAWYQDTGFNKRVDSSFISIKSQTLYARYLENDVPVLFNTTPFVNEKGFWVINGEETFYDDSFKELSISLDGFWIVGSFKTSYIVYTSDYKPYKCLNYSTSFMDDFVIEKFEMSDGTLVEKTSENNIIKSISAFGYLVSTQEFINQVPDVALEIQTDNSVYYVSLEHYRIANIETLDFTSATRQTLRVYYFGSFYEIEINFTKDQCLISGEEKYDFHTKLQKDFLTSNLLDIENYCIGKEELSKPKYYIIKLSKKLDEHSSVKIVETDSNLFEYSLGNNSSDIYVFNLEMHKRYCFYCVIDDLATNKLIVDVASDVCRNIDVGGVTNCRDIGGKETKNGLVEQGLLFRTASLNKSYSSTIETFINQRGLSTFENALKIKTEVDLRLDDGEQGKYKSSAISGVDYLHYKINPGLNLPNLLENREVIARLFNDVLSEKDNYPMIMHCSIGTDRTGLICYLLLGALGCDDDAILKDYLFSNFGLINADRNLRSLEISFTNSLSFYEGNSISERSINYLLDIGVELNSLNMIRQIFFNC